MRDAACSHLATSAKFVGKHFGQCSWCEKLRNDRNRRKVAVTASEGENDAILFGSPPTGNLITVN